MQARAPELAAGKLLKVLTDMTKPTMIKLMVRHRPFLNYSEWQDVVGDFEAARSHASAQLQLKLGFWQKLPWSLCAWALPDENEARSHAVGAVQQYDATELRVDGVDAHHRVAVKFLDPRGHIRKLVDQWLSGTSIKDPSLELLFMEVAKLGLIPVVERVIEGRASQVRHALTGKHATPVLASLALRLDELTFALQEKDFQREFSTCWKDVQHARKIAVQVGLQNHPDVVALEASDRKTSRSAWIKLLGKVSCHSDLSSQFAQLPLAKRAHHKKQTAELQLATGIQSSRGSECQAVSRTVLVSTTYSRGC